MRQLDCTDIRVMLSGLVDDELESTERHEAERHLAQCKRCRELLNEAEGLDELVQLETGERVCETLPDDFEERVLDRTVRTRGRSYWRHWNSWAGWAAAAASLAFAATIWLVDRGGQTPDGTPARAAEVSLRSTSYGNSLRSWTRDDETAGAIQGQAQTAGEAARDLTREDAQTLYFTSVLLDLLQTPPTDVGQIQEAIEYEQLLPRLEELRERLPASDRATLYAAESLLVRLSVAPVEDGDLESLRATASALDLASTIDSMSQRWDARQSL
ncbi:MAG: zf-HC2 domain-containing protein [Planctomycetota bacterium]|jgi:hypothetical protein